MSLTDRPVVPGTAHLYPRRVYGIAATYDGPDLVERTILTVDSNDLDPEMRTPGGFLSLMIEGTDPGRAVMAAWRQYAEDAPEDYRIEVRVDGTWLIDVHPFHVVAEYEAVGAAALRPVVNP